MKYDLFQFEKLVDEGYLRKDETEDLVIYSYTDLTVFERKWDDITRISRGIILDKKTGEAVAKPFPKFFNLNEMPETKLENLPSIPYRVYDKLDGSLGIIFNYKGQWKIATRGSFKSDQAIKATEILKKYDLSQVPEYVTLLTEIIYPANKIVVNYGDIEELVLLTAFDRLDCTELNQFDLASIKHNLPSVKIYGFSLTTCLDKQSTLSKDEEGFVIVFENGLRLKIKGDEYCRVFKIISQLSPLSIWEVMKYGKVSLEYLSVIPEEFRPETDEMVLDLEHAYGQVLGEIGSDITLLDSILEKQNKTIDIKDIETRKIIGKLTQEIPCQFKHKGAIFSSLLKNESAVEKYIMKYIRPTGNNMVRRFDHL